MRNTVRNMKQKMFEDLERDTPKYPNQVLTLTIPVPPSVNHMYIHKKNGQKILTKAAKQYVKTVQDLCKKAIKEQKWRTDKEAVWFVMDMYFYFPDKRKRDNHNCLKILLDTLEGLLFTNDYFVLPRAQHVTLDRENPRVEIIFYPQEV